MPNPDTETLYLKSVNTTVDQYRAYLSDLKASNLKLANMDFDTGNRTTPGEYRLTDEAYAKLLDKLTKEKFGGMLPDLRETFGLLPEPFCAQLLPRRNWEKWNKVQQQLQELKTSVNVQASPQGSQ